LLARRQGRKGCRQTETIDLGVVARRFDQALAALPFATPDAGERKMKGNLHRIL
jgi:hypothetical protein